MEHFVSANGSGIFAQKPCISAEEHFDSMQGPYISSTKEPYTSAKESYVSAKKLRRRAL